jgi:hypothetical protein
MFVLVMLTVLVVLFAYMGVQVMKILNYDENKDK